MTDIVDRLRKQALEMYDFSDHELMREAADEIEKLRKLVDNYERTIDEFPDVLRRALGESTDQ